MSRLKSIFRDRQWNAAALLVAVLLISAVVFGGASRDHALRLALVELAALPVLVLAGSQLLRRQTLGSHRMALGLLGAIGLLPLIQLVPLPPAIWTALPGRGWK